MVLKRSDLSLTHIVVDIGFLRSGHHLWEGGFGLDYDRVVPIDQVHAASEKRVELALTAAEFKDQPEYTHRVVRGPSRHHAQRVRRLEMSSCRPNDSPQLLASTPTVWIVEKLNKPLDSVDIKEGTAGLARRSLTRS